MDLTKAANEVRLRVTDAREDILRLLREIVAIPSMEGRIQEVGERIAREMTPLGFEDIRFDRMGNILGRMGSGPVVMVYDSHIDTVGIGDPDAWKWDPFQGKEENGILYARGAGDEKGSTPGMVYGLAIAGDLGLLEGVTAYYFGNMEEWCDGIAPHALVEAEGIRPNRVVIGESTRMRVYRGQKGRVEMKVVAKGRSAHAASNELGENAVYKLLPVIAGVQNLEPSLGDHPFLGKGKITVTDMQVKTVSINAVPDEATIWIDRRLTFGETKDQALAEVSALIPPENRDGGDIQVKILFYNEPSYTGFVFPEEKYFPAWTLEEDHSLVQAGLKAYELYFGRPTGTGKWNFSTNGTYWMGKAGIPAIGFGPGDEVHAHTVLDQVPLHEVVDAAGFYALLPALVSKDTS
ncbi:MAG: YgeY family selenium metabolism-linked hydrolase [Deltaproteobacteria bacterium]|nr:YgeY family selenium metabolism-linked hydrolase [Deltaproteobacteria bacterium]